MQLQILGWDSLSVISLQSTAKRLFCLNVSNGKITDFESENSKIEIDRTIQESIYKNKVTVGSPKDDVRRIL